MTRSGHATTHCGRLRTTDIDEAELVERAAREPRAVVRGRDVADDGRGRDVAVVDERAQEDERHLVVLVEPGRREHDQRRRLPRAQRLAARA